MRRTQKERKNHAVSVRSREAFVVVRAVAFRVGYRIDDQWKKKSAHNFESRSRFSFPFERGKTIVAPDHDAPSRVLDRLGFAAFVLDFPDVCRKKKEKKRRRGGGAKARVSECRFLRERERDALVDPRRCVFGAAVVSLIFSKIGL